MKEIVIDPPLIGSGSQEEADARVQALLDLGKSRSYLTDEELNTKLPDEVVSPDKLDSLLMMIDEMGIKLIDEQDVAEYQAKPRGRPKAAKVQLGGALVPSSASAPGKAADEPDLDEDEE